MSVRRIKNKISISIISIIILTITGLYMTSNSYLLRKANACVGNGDNVTALNYYNKIKKTDLDILFKKLELELGFNYFESALNTLNAIEEKAINENIKIDLTKHYYNKILCLYNLRKDIEVIDISKEFLSISKDILLNKEVEDTLLNSYLILDRYLECIEAINSFIPKYEGTGDKKRLIKLYNDLAYYYSMMEDDDMRLVVYDKLIHYNPENLEHHIDKAKLLNKNYGRKPAYEYLFSVKDRFERSNRYLIFLGSYQEYGDK